MTLLSANDRFEILDLCSRYNRSLDQGNEEDLMACWVRSGIAFECASGKYADWDGLRRFFSKELHGGFSTGKRHLIFNIVIRDAESVDAAFVDSEYLIIDVQNHFEIVGAGSYKNDKVIRTSMGWGFQKRYQKPDLGAISMKATLPPAHTLT